MPMRARCGPRSARPGRAHDRIPARPARGQAPAAAGRGRRRGRLRGRGADVDVLRAAGRRRATCNCTRTWWCGKMPTSCSDSARERERSLFRELLKVSGVGPRIALAILSGVTVDEFHRCVEAQDFATLVRVPGIGRKTAERLVIEMRDRLKGLEGPAFAPGAGGSASRPRWRAGRGVRGPGVARLQAARGDAPAAEGGAVGDVHRRTDPPRAARGGLVKRVPA